MGRQERNSPPVILARSRHGLCVPCLGVCWHNRRHDLQFRRHQPRRRYPPSRPHRTDGQGRQCAGKLGLDRQPQRHHLQREAQHRYRRSLCDGIFAGNSELHGRKSDKWDYLLLRRFRCQFRRRKCQLLRSERQAHNPKPGAGRSIRAHGHRRQHAGQPHMVR